MNLRRNLLATAITSLLCFGQTVLATESTVILNGTSRTLDFADPADANTMISNPTTAQIGLFFSDTESPSSAGLVSQSELNGVPITMIKASGAQAVIAQPNADGSTGFFTLSTVGVTGADGKQATLNSLIESYATAVNDPANATAEQKALLSQGLYTGVSGNVASAVSDSLKAAATATVGLPVNVAAGGAPTDNTDPAAIVRANLLQQVLANGAATLTVPSNGLTTTALPDLQAITSSSVVQKKAADVALSAAEEVATTLANDPTLADAVNAAVATAQSNQATAELTYLNDDTVTKSAEEIAAGVKTVYDNGLSVLNSTTASLSDKEKSKLALDDLISKFGSNLTADQTAAIQAAEVVLANDQTIAAQLAILNGTATGDKATALKTLQALLSDTSLKPYQIAEIKTDLATYGVDAAVTTALNTLTSSTATAAQKTAALKTLESAYDTAKKNLTSADELTKIKAQANLNAIAGKIASAELSNANSALSAATHRLANTTTAGQIISGRQALHNAEGSAAKSTKYKDLSVANTASAGTTALSAAQVQAQAQTALANTGTAEYWARNTSANGIAGNPSSMLNMTADHMFSQGADINNLSTIASGTTAGGVQHSINAGLQYNYYNLAGTNVNTVSLPLSYTTQINSKSQVILSVPLSYISQNKNDTYQVGAGVAFKYNATDRWSLTPAFSYSYRTADTTDYSDYYAKRALGDGVSVMGGGLTSKYDWDYNDIKISMTNMGGYFAVADGFGATSPLALGYSNDLGNFVLKNGVSVGKSLNGFGVTTYLNDAEYFGSTVFFDQYNEFGFALKPENMGALNAFSVNANYLFSFKGGKRGDLDGFKLNLNYKF
ncbi:MAG: hypothetical protein WAX77_01655 [Methylococcaceae bacterium]